MKLTTAPQVLDKKDLLSSKATSALKPHAVPVSQGRPRSSPAVRVEPPQGKQDDQIPASLTSSSKIGQSAASSGVGRRKRDKEVAGGTGGEIKMAKEEEVKEKSRPRTADGRPIEALRFTIPVLGDHADPAMIAHRY